MRMSTNPYHNSANLSTMPDLCLLWVFRRLPLSTLYGTVGQVCRNWTRLQPEALAQRRRLVLMSSRSDQGEVIDRLYYQQYREMECDDVRTLIQTLGDQYQDEYLRTFIRRSREDIARSILCFREKYPYMNPEDEYLHQIGRKLPRITNLALMFGEILNTEGLMHELREEGSEQSGIRFKLYDYDYQNSRDHGSRVEHCHYYPEYIKSFQDLEHSARKAVAQMCTLLGHYHHQLVHLTVELDLSRCWNHFTYLESADDPAQWVETVEAANQLVGSLNTTLNSASLRELYLHYRGPEPTKPLAIGSNSKLRLLASFGLIMKEPDEYQWEDKSGDWLVKSLAAANSDSPPPPPSLHLVQHRPLRYRYQLERAERGWPEWVRRALRNMTLNLCPYRNKGRFELDNPAEVGHFRRLFDHYFPSLTSLRLNNIKPLKMLDLIRLLDTTACNTCQLISLAIDFYDDPEYEFGSSSEDDDDDDEDLAQQKKKETEVVNVSLPSVKYLILSGFEARVQLDAPPFPRQLGVSFPSLAALQLYIDTHYEGEEDHVAATELAACWQHCPELSTLRVNQKVFHR